MSLYKIKVPGKAGTFLNYLMFLPGASCKCGEGYYLCQDDKTCVHEHMICDGDSDCPGNDDEASCREYNLFVSKV